MEEVGGVPDVDFYLDSYLVEWAQASASQRINSMDGSPDVPDLPEDDDLFAEYDGQEADKDDHAPTESAGDEDREGDFEPVQGRDGQGFDMEARDVEILEMEVQQPRSLFLQAPPSERVKLQHDILHVPFRKPTFQQSSVKHGK